MENNMVYSLAASAGIMAIPLYNLVRFLWGQRKNKGVKTNG